jgi:hypothetical protein
MKPNYLPTFIKDLKGLKSTSSYKALRVVLLEDGITIHNAFFDRNFKP